MHDITGDVTLAFIDGDEIDEASADLLDLHFVSIIHQHERKQLYLLHPTIDLQDEINTHEGYISFASSLMSPMQQQIIARFQNLVTYGEPPIDLTAQEMHDLVENATNATDLNAQVTNELDWADLDAVVLHHENETNATDLNAQATNDLMDLDAVVLQQKHETNATQAKQRMI